ncbi:Serine/threonine-protein kinase [Ceratobasidium sp. AG-Ba]|nr:Serine/threonine-protein kinase [Ceratobasidium sp. AG-Ba]
MAHQPQTSPRLRKASHVLGEAFDVIYPCPESKEAAIVLIARAERVLATIDPTVKQAKPHELQYEIERVEEVAEETKRVMQSIASKSFAKRLVDQAHDSRDIEVVNLKLTDVLRLFHAATESQIAQDIAISEGARKNDQYHIEQKMRQLQADDQALCNEFNVTTPNTALSMVREFQLMVISLDPQSSPRARHFLEHALKVFRGRATSKSINPDDSSPSIYSQTSFSSTTGSMRVHRTPQWVINESDIKIDENSPLGRGGFGTVFKGQWNGATVAVKRLVKDASAETLLREVETWQGLRHPHVVQFFGASPRDSPNAFIVSQYLANGNALMYLKRNPDADRVKLARETAVGMEYLHSMGIIHGDLKAANVLITDTGGAALADFGLSEVKQDSTSRANTSENVSGSPRYLSPERWRGVLNKASDVYAWAMTTLEIFTDLPPFGYINGVELIYHLVVRENQRPDRPDPETGLQRGLTDDIWFLITKAWEKDPQERPTFKQLTQLFPESRGEIEPEIDDLQAQFASMLPNTASGTSIDVSQTSLSSMTPVQTTAPLQLGGRSQAHLQPQVNNINHEIESAEIEILPPPSYDVVTNTPSAGNLTFPASISGSANTTLSSIPGPITPPSSTANRSSWYPPEKRGFHQAPPQQLGESSGSYGQAGSSRSIPSPPNTANSLPQRALPSPAAQSIREEHSQVAVTPPVSPPAVQVSSPPAPLSPPRRAMTRSEKRSSVVPAPLNSELSVSQALMAAVNKGTDQAEMGKLVCQVIDMAEDEGQAKKLVEAGAIPTLITRFKDLSPGGEGINHVILALGLLSHDLLSANSVVRTGTATMLMEISKAARDEPVRACSAWCLGRLVHSDDIATRFIRDGLPELLLAWMSTSRDKMTLRSCVWTLGTLARTDALAGKLVDARAIPALATHLQQTAVNVTDADPEDLGVALFGVGRIARTIKFSKALAAAGSVEPMVRTLRQTLDPHVLNWAARAIGCHMRPNSADMAKILLADGAADGLARLPRVIPAHETDALGSFAFAIARFSCAEWGSGTRKALVQAGVVDALLSALRAASAVPTTNPRVHAELAFAVSFLGDVGGSAIRKEIQDAGGIEILRQVARQGPPDVRKACETAITTITGNVFTRSTASTKTALTHDWSGGCPDYPIIHPDFESWI